MFEVATEKEVDWVLADYPEHGIHIAFTEGIEGDRSNQRRYMVNGKKWPSVSQICDKHFARTGLDWWRDNCTIDGMLDIQNQALAEFDPAPADGSLPRIPEMPKTNQSARRALWMSGATADQIRDAAAINGTIIHTALEDWHQYQQIPSLTLVDEKRRGKMQALAAFLYDTRPDILSCEVLVASKRYHYAGRFDARMAFYKPTPVPVQLTQEYDSVEPRILPPGIYLTDVKSGSKLWPENDIKLALYEQASRELGYQRTQGRFCIHLREDGTYAIRFYDGLLSVATGFVRDYWGHMDGNLRSTARNKRLAKVEAA